MEYNGADSLHASVLMSAKCSLQQHFAVFSVKIFLSQTIEVCKWLARISRQNAFTPNLFLYICDDDADTELCRTVKFH